METMWPQEIPSPGGIQVQNVVTSPNSRTENEGEGFQAAPSLGREVGKGPVMTTVAVSSYWGEGDANKVKFWEVVLCLDATVLYEPE